MVEELGLPLCVFCRTRQTKYKCVLCDSVACNICTNAVGEDHEDYDEESKKVGVCENCQSCSSLPERPADPPRKVQATLFSMFSRSNKRSLLSSDMSTKNTNSRKQARINSLPNSIIPAVSSTSSVDTTVSEDVSIPSNSENEEAEIQAGSSNIRAEECHVPHDSVETFLNKSAVYKGNI